MLPGHAVVGGIARGLGHQVGEQDTEVILERSRAEAQKLAVQRLFS